MKNNSEKHRKTEVKHISNKKRFLGSLNEIFTKENAKTLNFLTALTMVCIYAATDHKISKHESRFPKN
jgi:hypothetical protein